MLPTPSTSHVDFERIYEPAEDSYLLLDTLSSPSEKAFLSSHFSSPSHQSSLSHQNASSTPPNTLSNSNSNLSSNPYSHSPNILPPPSNLSPSPLILEIGTGSGIVLSFIHAHALTLFNRPDIVTLGVDVNLFACHATAQTVSVAEKSSQSAGTSQDENGLQHGFYMGNVLGDLTSCLRKGEVDVLVFNPPYVPTSTLPSLPPSTYLHMDTPTTFDGDSHLLELAYAGGANGMETTNRLLNSLPKILSVRGCAYVLLCAHNKPVEVQERIGAWEGGAKWMWRAEKVGSSGKTAGWEKLVIVRIWRDFVE